MEMDLEAIVTDIDNDRNIHSEYIYTNPKIVADTSKLPEELISFQK